MSANKDFGYSILLQCPECNKETETLSVDTESTSGIIIVSFCKKCDIKWRTKIDVERMDPISETINRINKFKN